MKKTIIKNGWGDLLASAGSARNSKPRSEGITVVIDKAFGVESTREFVAVAAPYVDVVKLTSLTSFFYPSAVLKRKIAILRDAGIEVAPGGTFTEVALWKGEYRQFLDRAKRLGFTGVEVSDGTIEMDYQMREKAIGMAADSGFRVFSEIGRKEWSDQSDLAQLEQDLKRDLQLGAEKVIVEAMEFGRGVGIIDEKGNISEESMWSLINVAGGPANIIWEAPIRQQQELFIDRIGANVNLGNIPPQEVLVVEASRLGFTGVPLNSAYRKSVERV